MSTMLQELRRHRPDWPTVPEELERAWSWLEQQGHGREAAAGYVLSPYPAGSGPAPAFLAGMSLDGWFEDGTVGHARLLPIAEAAGDGSLVALWRDDEERIRVVVLGSEGGGYMIAEDARALLTLLAVGYDELLAMNLGEPPVEPVPDEALAPLRSWLESELGATAPQEWPAVGDDEFSAWLDRQLGGEEPVAGPPADSGVRVTGEVLELLSVLGQPDGPDVAARVAGLTGVELEGPLRSSGAALRRVGLEASSDRHGVETIWVRMTDRPFGSIVRAQAPAYPRPAAFIDGLDPDSTLEDALALVGEPERRGPEFLRYVVQGRYLHLGFEDGRFVSVTLMVDAP